MKVLVTGGAGYIGSQFVYSLLDNNMVPVVVDNFSTGNKKILPKNISEGQYMRTFDIKNRPEI